MSREGWTIAASLAGLPFVVPHVLEDFAEGVAPRVGLAPPVAAFLLGLYLAVQMLGLVLVARARRAGWVITLGASAFWAVVALADHGPAVLAGGWRSGALSVLWVAGLVLSQGTAAALAWRGWRASAAGCP